MAVSTSAVTLAQYALMSNDPLVQSVTYALLERASILDDLPITTSAQLKAMGVRFQGSLPTVNWRNLNEEPTVTSGTPTPYEEQVYAVSNNIDVDRLLVMDKNQIVDPRAAQVGAYLHALRYDINDKFINNVHTTGGDAKAFVGIRNRIDNPSDWGLVSEVKIDGGGADMTTAMTATTANNFLEVVDTLLDYLGASDGAGVTLYCNDTLKRRFARAIRVLGAGAGFTTSRDGFGRAVDMYKNAKVVDLGRKADQSTRIITATEANTGVDGSSNYTSIYGVRYGQDGLFGWQMETLRAQDLGQVGNAGTIFRTMIDWAFGLYCAHTRAIGRAYNIKVS